MMIRRVIHYFDKLEDKIRTGLARRPVLYTLIGGIAVVLFWRGVWLVADQLHISGIVSLVVSIVVLLVTGLFVSYFIGDNIIISGLRKEKKLIEKTESEIRAEESKFAAMKSKIDHLEDDIHEVKDILHKKK